MIRKWIKLHSQGETICFSLSTPSLPQGKVSGISPNVTGQITCRKLLNLKTFASLQLLTLHRGCIRGEERIFCNWAINIHHLAFNSLLFNRSIYGTETTEAHLPSLKEKESKGHKIPFNPCAQTAKNTGLLLLCSDCSKPRLLHSKKKLKSDEALWFEGLLEVHTYSCGANVQDIVVEDEVKQEVYEQILFAIQQLKCRITVLVIKTVAIIAALILI